MDWRRATFVTVTVAIADRADGCHRLEGAPTV